MLDAIGAVNEIVVNYDLDGNGMIEDIFVVTYVDIVVENLSGDQVFVQPLGSYPF